MISSVCEIENMIFFFTIKNEKKERFSRANNRICKVSLFSNYAGFNGFLFF